MDPDALKSLGGLLLWAGLFFFMMRYGCGAHMMGGHGGHKHGGSAPAEKDPVCGMEVTPEKAAAATVHRGRTYYFCSKKCRDRFEQEPEKYTSATIGTTGESHHA